MAVQIAGTKQLKEQIEKAVWELFKAYDVDESGELNRDEFFKIEMRLCFEKGEVFDEKSERAKMTLADSDHSGSINYDEFKDRQLRSLTQQGFRPEEILKKVQDQTEMALVERRKMGPQWHSGVRQTLKRIFLLYDVSGDGVLSPEEWIRSQKLVAREISDDIDDSWIDEGAFQAADLNGDGVIQYDEFMTANFSMFEGVKMSSDEIYSVLQKVMKVLEGNQKNKILPEISIVQQAEANPIFMPPHESWQDEVKEDEADNMQLRGWEEKDKLQLGVELETVEDVKSLVRMRLQMPPNTWISLFYRTPSQADSRPIKLLKDNNVKEALEYFTKPNAFRRLFVKNRRPAPTKLFPLEQIWNPEREELLELMKTKKGQCWGFGWETVIKGDCFELPYMPMALNVGDAIIIEVPATDENGHYTYLSKAYADNPHVLQGPVEETIAPKAPKKKKKKGADAPAPDPNLEFRFVAVKEGSCTLFVDCSWEEEEPALAMDHKLVQPCQENSIARIGPIAVKVESGTSKVVDEKLWWNGEKWSNKNVPAKKKGGKKKK